MKTTHHSKPKIMQSKTQDICKTYRTKSDSRRKVEKTRYTEELRVRNTVRNRPKLSETGNESRTVSDTCPNAKQATTPVNTGFVRLSDLSDHFRYMFHLKPKLL